MYRYYHLPASHMIQMIQQARTMYSTTFVDHWLYPRHLGRIVSPDGYAKMHCNFGGMLEFFIKVKDKQLTDIRFWAEESIAMIVSGSMLAQLAIDRSSTRARDITSIDIFRKLGDLPEQNQQSTNLAVKTFQAAIDNYLSKSG